MRILNDIKKKEMLNNTNNKLYKDENKSSNNNNNNDNNNNSNNNNNNHNNDNNTNNDDNTNEINDNNSKSKRFKLKKNIQIEIPFNQIRCMVNLDTPNLYKELFVDSSILIGLHPDQATEIIVDIALKLNKPFAIIPCCVFANDFPHRKLKRKKTGNVENNTEYEEIQVSSYEQFIEYLCEKDKNIQKTFLPFEGKNLLLYKDKI